MQNAVSILAVADAWIYGIGIAQLVINIAMGLILYFLARSNRSAETIEQRLHSTATALIDTRLLQVTSTVEQHVKALTLMVDDLKEKIAIADEQIDGQSERAQKIELAVAGKFDELKDFLRENFAGKDDLEKFEATRDRQHGANEERMRELEMRVAVVADRLGTGKGTK